MKAKLAQFDTWGNSEDGYEINQAFPIEELEVPETIKTEDLLAMFSISPECVICDEYADFIEILNPKQGDRYLCPLFGITFEY